MTPQSEEQAVSGVAGFQNTTLLGKKLEHPYSVENMRKAWDSLKTANPNGRISREERDITTTHLYVKFMPHSSEDMDVLARDSTLDLYDYPLDYEILEHGDYYHDPNVPLDQPTPQYCAVKVGYPFPSKVEYEILEHLFAPDDYSDENIASGRVSFDDAWVDALVNESLRLTGNLEDAHDANEENEPRGRRRSKWRPAGRIRVWDNTLGSVVTRSRQVFDHWDYSACRSGGGYPIPLRARAPTSQCKRAVYRTENYSVTLNGAYVGLEGVEVRATRWGVHTHRGITNAQGNYSCDGRFRRPANYRIKWERYQYSIRTGTFGQATLNGPKRRGNWDVNIGNSSTRTVADKQQYYAFIHQAAYDYYYGSRFGLASPPRNGFFKPQVKISASQTQRQHNKQSHAASYARTLGVLPSIYVRTWNKPSDYVYGVTIHELAHAAHWDMDRSAMRLLVVAAYGLVPFTPSNSSAEAVIESWATGVEWMFATHRYRVSLNRPNFDYQDNFQTQMIAGYTTIADDLIYTSIVIDLMDNEDQRVTEGVGHPMDSVSGYTISQIEGALRGARSWNQFRYNLKTRYDISTRDFIDELFANWYN